MRNRILQLFESDVIAPQPHLQKEELSDEQFIRILVAKPGDINIILARTVSMLTNNEPTKTKQQITDEILEVLDRSKASRLFVGVGLQSSYHLYKGIPVRKGDQFESLPSQGDEIQLDKPGAFQSWVTDAPMSRQIATSFDPMKGDPLGGIVVDTHIDETKLFFDVNAVIRSCKIKMEAIRNYNNIAAQGKAISNKNVDYLASEASYYHDIFEVVTDPSVVNVRVVDTWIWAVKNGEKTPTWKTVKDAEIQKQKEQSPKMHQPEQPIPKRNEAPIAQKAKPFSAEEF